MIPLSVARQSQAVIDTTSFQRFIQLYQLRRLTTMMNRQLGSISKDFLGRPMLSVKNDSSNIKTNPKIRCFTKRHMQYSRGRIKCSKHEEMHDSRLMRCQCQRQLSPLCKRNTRYFSTKQDDLTNPIDRLQAFIDVPIIQPEDHLFKPSTQEIQSSGKFWNQSMKDIKFLKSVKFLGQLPEDDLPEVTFIGRSNVGKSSLIQTLFRESDVLVKTSKTPGHTRLLNFFEVKKHFRVVDVPGYGYRMPEDYPQMVEEFLKTRPRLVRTFLLLDGVSKLNETDMIGINMVEEFQLPYVIVITKIDKVSSSVLLRNMLEIQKVMKKAKFCFPQPFLVSAITGEGIPLLQTFVTYVTGNLAIEGM